MAIFNLLSIITGSLAANKYAESLGQSPKDLLKLFSKGPSEADFNYYVRGGQHFQSIIRTSLVNRAAPLDINKVVKNAVEKYRDRPHDIGAMKLAMLEMVDDLKYSNLYEDESTAQRLRAIKTSLSSTLDESQSAVVMQDFGDAFGKVTGAGDTLKARQEAYARVLASGRKRGVGVTAADIRTADNPLSFFGRFKDAPALPPSSTRLSLSPDSSVLKAAQDWSQRLDDRGINYVFDAKKDIYRQRRTIGNRALDVTVASFRVGNDTINIPLTDLKGLEMPEQGASVFFRDTGASTMYAGPSKLMVYDKGSQTPRMVSTLEHLFEGENPHILNLLEEMQATGKSADDLIFSLDTSAEGEASKILEYVDASDNPELSLARRGAQVQVLDPGIVPKASPEDMFNTYLEAGRSHGVELIPATSPGQVAGGKYGYVHTAEAKAKARAAGTQLEDPVFMRMLNMGFDEDGSLKTGNDIEKRFIRPLIDPFKNKRSAFGTTYGRRRLMTDADIGAMYAFRGGAYRDMLNHGLAPFINGTLFMIGDEGMANFSQHVPLKSLDDSMGLALDVRTSAGLNPTRLDNLIAQSMQGIDDIVSGQANKPTGQISDIVAKGAGSDPRLGLALGAHSAADTNMKAAQAALDQAKKDASARFMQKRSNMKTQYAEALKRSKKEKRPITSYSAAHPRTLKKGDFLSKDSQLLEAKKAMTSAKSAVKAQEKQLKLASRASHAAQQKSALGRSNSVEAMIRGLTANVGGDPILGRELGTVAGRNSVFEIAAGRQGAGGFEPFVYSQKLKGLIEKGAIAGESDQDRMARIAAANITFEEGELLGFNVVQNNQERQVVSLPGRGRVGLRDLVQTTEGYKVVLGRESSFEEGVKLEGTFRSGLSRNLLNDPGMSGKLAKAEREYIENVLEKGWLTAKDLKGFNANPAIQDLPDARPLREGGFNFTNLRGFKHIDPKTGKVSHPPSAAEWRKKWKGMSVKDRYNHYLEMSEKIRAGGINDLTVEDMAAIRRLQTLASAHALQEVGHPVMDAKERLIKGLTGGSDEVAHSLSGVVDFVSEGKYVTGTNIKELRNQQRGAVSHFGNISLEDIEKSDILDKSRDRMSGFTGYAKRVLGGRFSSNDTDELAKLLLLSQEKELHKGKKGSEVLGMIFGAEKTEGKVLHKLLLQGDSKARASLSQMGLSDDFLDTLTAGIKGAKSVFGYAWNTVRDISDIEQENFAKIERRYFDHLYHGMQNPVMSEASTLQMETIMKRMQTDDPGRIEAIKGLTSNVSGKMKEGELVYDIMASDRQVDSAEKIQGIRQKGGYIKYGEKSIYIPGEANLERITAVDTRAGRRVEDARLKATVDNILRQVKSGIDRDEIDTDALDSLRKTYTRDIFKITASTFSSRFEGRLRGTTYGQIRQLTDDFANVEETLAKSLRAKGGYTAGFGRRDIEVHFNELMRGASKEERAYLSEWKNSVLEGKRSYGVLGFQNPKLGPESMTMFEAYYDKALDEKGGVTLGVSEDSSPLSPSFRKRVAGFLTGKTSSDFDGDKAFFMVMGSSSGRKNLTEDAVKAHFEKLAEHTSDDMMKRQFLRQKAYYEMTFGYEKNVEKSLNRLAAAGEITKDTLDVSRAPTWGKILTSAFKKGFAQSEVGSLSNRILDLHAINYQLLNTGAIDVNKSRRLTAFLQAFEQKAGVGFKHSGQSIASYLNNHMASILSQSESPTSSLQGLTQLLGNLGFEVDDMDFSDMNQQNTRQAFLAVESVKQNYSLIEASRKSEKLSAKTILSAAGRDMSTAFNALFDADQEMSKMLIEGAQASVEAEFGPEQSQRMMKEYQERIAALNAGVHEDAAMSGFRKLTTTSGLDIVKEQAKGLLANSASRYLLVGAGVAAATYALFNKGYDDTPLTDIPAPPPGRSAMFATNADMQGISSGKFLNDQYAKTDMETQGMANMNYAESNIPAPSTIAQKSYINSATARISNRGLVLDRTNPIEYGRAIQSIIPGAQVGVSVNHNYNMPTDMERRL